MNPLTKTPLSLPRKFPRNNQKGFTLIEMLVVISILGILAAVVTMSMVGVTKIAQANADKAELKTVQVAMDTMASQQQLEPNQVCPTGPTNDLMDSFPNPKPSSTAPGVPLPLYPNYLHTVKTSRPYHCDPSTGVVSSLP